MSSPERRPRPGDTVRDPDALQSEILRCLEWQLAITDELARRRGEGYVEGQGRSRYPLGRAQRLALAILDRNGGTMRLAEWREAIMATGRREQHVDHVQASLARRELVRVEEGTVRVFKRERRGG